MARKSAIIKSLVAGIILLLVTSFQTGCAKTHYKHYEGPVLPDSELALIKSNKKICGIDGQSHRLGTTNEDTVATLTTGLFSEEFGRAYWQVLPGKHEIELVLGDPKTIKQVGGAKSRTVTWRGGVYKTTYYWIEVEKGHTYDIHEKSTFLHQDPDTKASYFRIDFFLEDICCPSREKIKLGHGKINRIE